MQSAINGQIPVIYIQQQTDIPQCLQELAQSPAFSFDLEFDNNRYAYGVSLCLIQVATPATCFIFDPLANLDLSGLFSLFQEASIQKLVHSPGEDLRLLHSIGCYPPNLFDTEIIARLLNYEQTSLANLLRDKLNYPISKKHQKSNWLRRPLSEEQVRYAADDVIWLHPLKDVLVAEAESRGLMPLVMAEQAHLSKTVYQQAAKTNFLKPVDFATLSPLEQEMTNELLRYRDELARQLNRPPFQVMGDELVRALANGSRTADSIQDEPGIHPRFRTPGFAQQLGRRIRDIRKAAAEKNLSVAKQERPRLTSEQHAQVRKAAFDREHLFAPIQQELVKRFGTYATQFLLSNRLVGDLVRDPAAVPQLLSGARQQLFKEIAAGLNLDVRAYLP